MDHPFRFELPSVPAPSHSTDVSADLAASQMPFKDTKRSFSTNGKQHNALGETNMNEQNFQGWSAEERPPFKEDDFVGRFEERRRIEQRLQEISKRELKRPLVEVVGPTSIGKSWLLSMLRTRYALPADGVRATYPTFSVYLNLADLKQETDEEREQPSPSWIHHFLYLLVHAIAAALRIVLPQQFERLREPRPALPLDPIEQTSILDELHNWLKNLWTAYHPIFLIDSTEQADSRELKWLEHEILLPLIQSRQVLVVVAGRKPVQWREPAIRLYYDLWNLEPLKRTEWHEQIAVGEKRIPLWVHEKYALGHPGMAWYLYDELVKGDLVGKDDAATLEDTPHFSEILEQALRRVVLNDVPYQDIPEVSLNLQDLLFTVGVLRVFNPDVLEHFTHEFGPEIYKAKKYPFFRQAVREMIRNDAVRWSSALEDYTTSAPIIRRVLSSCLKDILGRDIYRTRQEEALKWYEGRLERGSQTAPWSIPEILYHRAKLAQLKEERTIAQVIQDVLDKLFTQIAPRDTRILDELRERLRDEHDPDVRELNADLRNLLDAESFDNMLNQIEDMIKQRENQANMVPA